MTRYLLLSSGKLFPLEGSDPTTDLESVATYCKENEDNIRLSFTLRDFMNALNQIDSETSVDNVHLEATQLRDPKGFELSFPCVRVEEPVEEYL